MNIVALLHYSPIRNRAGGELFMHALLATLAQQPSTTVTAYVTHYKDKHTVEVLDGVTYHYGGFEAMQFSSPDVIISHLNHADLCLTLSNQKEVPFIYLCHNERPQSLTTAQNMGKKDLIVYNTAWVAKAVGVAGMVCYPPVQALHKLSTGNLITFINLIELKGVDYTYQIVKALPQYQFLGVKGGYYKDEQDIRQYPNLTIIDNTSDIVNDVYMRTKLLIQPSRYETYGMVQAEAIQMGIPCIVSPTAGLKENLGDAGIYIANTAIDLWVQQITMLMEDPIYYAGWRSASVKRGRQKQTNTDLNLAINAILDKVK